MLILWKVVICVYIFGLVNEKVEALESNNLIYITVLHWLDQQFQKSYITCNITHSWSLHLKNGHENTYFAGHCEDKMI